MSVVAPPEPPRPDELELLIREARARQLRRRLGAVAVVAVLLGTSVATYAIFAGSGERSTTGGLGAGRAATPSSSRCGVRVRGPNVFRDGRIVFRDRVASPMSHEIRCSGSTVWAVFVNGIGTNVESYVGARSGDRGRTWRVAFGQNYQGLRADRGLGPELGAWTLSGSRAAYFIGWCGPCSVSGRFGTADLIATTDGGRTFRHYAVPALAGFSPRRLRVTGRVVTIWGRQLAQPYTHKVVRLRVA